MTNSEKFMIGLMLVLIGVWLVFGPRIVGLAFALLLVSTLGARGGKSRVK